MKGSNSLGSHMGESCNSRADKMSGWVSQLKRIWKHEVHGTMSFTKKFYTKKRRMFLNNPNNWDKL